MMALYLEEKIIQEKKEDPLKRTITFTHPWIINISPEMKNENTFLKSTSIFSTKYMFHAAEWRLDVTRTRIRVRNPQYLVQEDEFLERFNVPMLIWYGTCYCSYNLYADNDMCGLLYSSPKIEMLSSEEFDSFKSPDGYMAKFRENLDGKNVTKIVVFIELQLPSKYFYHPFTMPNCRWKKVYDGYPKDITNDFRFDYLKETDFLIKCIGGGSVPATRLLLNLSSEFFKDHFKKSNESEIFVDHRIDVVKPIVILLHTWYFEMPELFDLNYAKRLFEASRFFQIVHGNTFDDFFQLSVHRALCKKFVKEKHKSFTSLLEWISITFCYAPHMTLQKMITVVIAEKFYHEWHHRFPVNARNFDNPDFRNVFGGLYSFGTSFLIFDEVENIMKKSFLTNVILP